MIVYKTTEEIAIMTECGRMLRKAAADVMKNVAAGVTTMKLDTLAREFLRREGAEPSFVRVPGYSWAICSPVNEQVVHTPPGERVLKDGDLLTIDMGAWYKGFHTDYATTVVVGTEAKPEVARFLQAGEIALKNALSVVKVGNRIGHISQEIQSIIRGRGYGVMKQLTGHGVGRELHEDPFIPGYVSRPIEKTPLIKEGMVLAIEVIYSMGSEEIAHEPGDDWSIVSADGSLTACFEHTVAVTEQNTVVLT